MLVYMNVASSKARRLTLQFKKERKVCFLIFWYFYKNTNFSFYNLVLDIPHYVPLNAKIKIKIYFSMEIISRYEFLMFFLDVFFIYLLKSKQKWLSNRNQFSYKYDYLIIFLHFKLFKLFQLKNLKKIIIIF